MQYRLPIFYDYVFPNYVLPNAMITELGMVNYLHSLNSNKVQIHSFFDQSLNSGSDSNNVLTFMFGESLGTFPNVTGGCGTHLQSEMYENIVQCEENTVFFGKRNNTKKYIYPIRMSPHVDNFVGAGVSGSKINGEYFWKHMSAAALKDAQEGRALILLDLAQENFMELHSYANLHTCLKRSGIPKEQIILAFNSFNAQEIYKSWFPPEERRLEVRNWPFVLSNTSYYYEQATYSRLNIEQFKETKDILRKNYFLFKIRRPRPHRQALLFKMCEDNFLEKADWSWLSNANYRESEINAIKNQYKIEADNEKIKNLFSQFPHSLQDEPGDTFDTVSSWTDKQFLSYKNSYFYVCTETYTHGEYKSVTEKVCKPMINFMPFLFLSFCGALKLLKSLGFKTFAPFIDESYDDEPDEVIRLEMIYKEITKLCAMSKEEIHKWYWNMEDIFIHNHNHLINFYKTDEYTINLVEYLHKRINDDNS